MLPFNQMEDSAESMEVLPTSLRSHQLDAAGGLEALSGVNISWKNGRNDAAADEQWRSVGRYAFLVCSVSMVSMAVQALS